MSVNFEPCELSEIERDIDTGRTAEEQVCTYVDSIVTAWNPCTPDEGWVRPEVHPCKKNFRDIPANEMENDYRFAKHGTATYKM